MRELREDTFFGNKNGDSPKHVERILDIVSLFNILGVSHDAVILRVFPITLTGAAKRWVDRLSPGTVDSWYLLKKAFIQRYCPPSKTAKKLEEIRNFKQEGDETLYQAWEWYNDLSYRCPTHDINSHQKVNIFYNGLGTMNRQLLDSQGSIPGMTPAQALTVIQTMADHSQKWHDGSSSRNIDSSSNSKGIAAIVNTLYSLGRDMKKLKENVYAIQVGCQTYEGAHLDKEYPLKEEIKSFEEVKYGEFEPSSPFSNGAKYHVAPPRYYTRIDNRPSFREKRPILEELMNKHLEESTRRRAEMEECVKKLQENEKINTQNQSAFLKNLETQIEQLTKEFHAKTASEVNNSSFDQCKAVYTDKEAPLNNEINKPHEVSFVQEEDLGEDINVIPKSMFEYLKLARLKKTNMLVEMVDMTKRAPIGIVENVLVKIDKFLFPLDFVFIDMLNTRNETMILGRPFLATIHAEIDVFNKEISLGIRNDRVTFDMDKKIHNFTTPVGKTYMINSIHNDEFPSHSNALSNKSSRFEKSENLHNENNYIHERSSKKTRILKADTNLHSTHFYKPVKQICNGILKVWPTCDPTMKTCNGGIEIYGMNKEGVLKLWYCYLDGDRESIKWNGLSFPEFLLVKYKEAQEKELIWDNRYAEWCNENSSPDTPTSRFTSVQEDYKPRPKDYPFKDWLLTKIVKDPRSRSFDDDKWMFDLEIDQLAGEYELWIGKKGHMLNEIWENCKKVQGDNTYWWYDKKSGEEERQEIRVNIEGYDPPRVHVESFEIKRYSFDSSQSFICVTKELMDALPLGRENRSRFREMIRKEVDSGRKVHRKTFSQQGIGIRGLLDSFSCGKKVLSGRNHLGYAIIDAFMEGYEIAQDTRIKSSSLAIIT
ncbi:reverse transcriptase domain-containing protein [Tanacetum coccineum]